MKLLGFEPNDGGRAAAGFKGTAGDCVARAIAIATERPYEEVYNALHDDMRSRRRTRKYATSAKRSPRNGVPKDAMRRYLEGIGWTWTPTMHIGQGCKVHLRADELPAGRLIVSVSSHVLAVIDGVMHDTYRPDRAGTRCVYGYWSP